MSYSYQTRRGNPGEDVPASRTGDLLPTAPTIELRRYRIADGQADAFTAWFRRATQTRRPYGFEVEFAYLDRAGGQFVWAVRHDGDQEEFADAERRWRADPERARVFADLPDCLLETDVVKVEPVPTS
jgi:hypothetical protein